MLKARGCSCFPFFGVRNPNNNTKSLNKTSLNITNKENTLNLPNGNLSRSVIQYNNNSNSSQNGQNISFVQIQRLS